MSNESRYSLVSQLYVAKGCVEELPDVGKEEQKDNEKS